MHTGHAHLQQAEADELGGVLELIIELQTKVVEHEEKMNECVCFFELASNNNLPIGHSRKRRKVKRELPEA